MAATALHDINVMGTASGPDAAPNGESVRPATRADGTVATRPAIITAPCTSWQPRSVRHQVGRLITTCRRRLDSAWRRRWVGADGRPAELADGSPVTDRGQLGPPDCTSAPASGDDGQSRKAQPNCFCHDLLLCRISSVRCRRSSLAAAKMRKWKKGWNPRRATELNRLGQFRPVPFSGRGSIWLDLSSCGGFYAAAF